MVGGRLIDIRRAGVTPIFDTFTVEYRDQRVDILRHCIVPVLAFARPDPGRYGVVDFVDHPVTAAAFRAMSKVTVMTAAEMRSPLSRADLSALSTAELRVVADMKPDTIGELLFNYWD